MENKLFGGKTGNEGVPMDLAQQMLLASQLGIPPAMLDPSLSLSSGMMNSPQSALALQQQIMGMQSLGAFNPAFSFGAGANALPPMDSNSQRALDAMTQELNNQMMASNMLSSGAQDPLALAQQAQLIASLNGYVPPNMLSQMFNPFLNQSLPHSSHKDKGHRRGNEASNNTASTSRETPNQLETTSKPKQSASPHSTKPNNNMSPEQLYKALTNQHQSTGKNAQKDQAMQAEMVHQLEQQLIMHQFQQQQDHIQDAIKSMNKPNSELSSLQQQLTQSMYQQSLMSPPNALNPALNDYMLNSQLMAMGQMSNNFLKEKNFEDSRKKSSDSSKHTPTHRNNSTKQDSINKFQGKVNLPKPNKYNNSPSKSSQSFSSYHKDNKNEDRYNLSSSNCKSQVPHSKELPLPKIKKEPIDFAQNLSNDALFKDMFSKNSLQSNRKVDPPLASKNGNNLPASNEKDFFMGIQSMLASGSNSLPSANSQTNQIEKAMQAAYEDIVKNAQNCDLNKMNEVLSCIVAAEMQRLQEQQFNLTRELDLLNKSQDKKSVKSEPANRVSVIHKANSSENDRESVSQFNFEKVSADLFVPLDRRWKRETKFKCLNQSIKAYVVYVSPNGDTLRNMEDIMNYLKEKKIFDLQRRDFSFDYHIPVGSFYEQGDQKWNKLTDEEQIRSIIQMIDNINDPKGQNEKQRRKQKWRSKTDQLKQINEDKMKMDFAALKEADLKMRQEKLMRQQERQQRLEQQRIEREAREHQLIEEREIRKQQLIFLKALETKKRALEKDRRREEIRNERIYMREKKMEQRRLALELARQLKMPVEDMCLKDNTPLPELQNLLRNKTTKESKSLPKLSGNSVADVLMVMEFIHNFKEIFHLEESSIPAINEIHLGLLNDPSHTEAVTKIIIVLLHQCLCDPGVPAPGPWLHCTTGLKVTDIDVCRDNYSEILRLFLWARNGYKTEVALKLETIPFLSLSSEEKTSVLAFLVNELVCSRPIYLEIERHLETLSSLRRDKWIVEGKIRQVRIEHANDGSDVSLNSSPLKHKPKIKSENTEDQEDKDDKESVKDDEDSNATDDQRNKKDSVMEKKMKLLTKEHHSFNDRLFVSSKPLRALNMGQDRFKRRYWVLSNLGGVYVEGLESGGCHDDEGCEESGSDEEDEKEEEQKSENTFQNSDHDLKRVPEDSVPPESKDEETRNFTDTEPITTEQNIVDKKQVDSDDVNQESDSMSGRTSVETGATETDSQRKPLGNITAVECNIIGNMKEENPLCSDTNLNTVPYSNGVIATCDNQGLAENRTDSAAMVVDITKTNGDATEMEKFSENLTASSEKMAVDENITNLDKPELTRQNEEAENHQTKAIQENNDANLQYMGDINGTNDHQKDSTNQSNMSRNSNALDITENGVVSTTQKPTSDDDVICTSSSPLVQQNALTDSDPNNTSVADKSESVLPPVNDNNTQEDSPMDFTSNTISKPEKIAQHYENVLSENQNTDSNMLREKKLIETEDSVILAAKAIAAKAVASSSHILFPKSSKDSTGKKEIVDLSNINPKLAQEKNEQRTNDDIEQQKPTSELNFEPGKLALDGYPIPSQVYTSTLQYGIVDCQFFSVKDHILGSLIPNPARNSNRPKISNNPKNGFSLTSEVLQNLGLSPNDLSQDQMAALFKIGYQQHTNCLKQSVTEDPSNEAIDLSKPSNRSQNPVKLENNSEFIPASNLDDIKREIPTPVEYSLMDLDMRVDYYPAMNKNELAMMEQLNELNQKSILKEPLPIPRGMKRGWWKIDSEESFHKVTETLHSRGTREKYLQSTMSKYRNYCSESIELSAKQDIQSTNSSLQENEKIGKACDQNQENRDNQSSCNLQSSTETAYRLEMEMLQQVKDLAKHLVDVGILLKDWMQHHTIQMNRDDLSHIPYVKQGDLKHDCTNPIKHHPSSILGVAVELLTSLEFCLPRNYLKPPLIRKGGASEFSSLPSLSESGASDVAAGLRSWRNAVATATSVSQLSMCVAMLNTSIAWERSPITFGAKSKKRKCDKRAAIKPQASETKKRKTKSSDNSTGEKTNSNRKNLVNGESANLENRSSRNTEPRQTSKTSLDQSSEEQQNDSPFSGNEKSNKVRKKKKKKKNKDQQGKAKARKSFAACCKSILKELQAHENATWFLFPVDTKVIPEYRKVIKKPIDFNTIQNRLKKGRYKDPEIFATDMRLVFDNCKLYNTDDSPIGQAGHALRSVFEQRWNAVEKEMFVTQTKS